MAKKEPYDDVDTSLVAFVAFVSTVVVFVTIVVVQVGYYYFDSRTTAREMQQASILSTDSSWQQQQQSLRQTGWVSKKEGTVQIPIDRAMHLVVREMRESAQESKEDTTADNE